MGGDGNRLSLESLTSANKNLIYYRYLSLQDKDKLIENALKTVEACNRDMEISLFYTQTAIAIAAIVK